MTEIQKAIIEELSERLLDHDLDVKLCGKGFDALSSTQDCVLLYLIQNRINLSNGQSDFSLLQDSYNIEVLFSSFPLAAVCILGDLVVIINLVNACDIVKGMHTSVHNPDFMIKTIDALVGLRYDL